MIREVKYPRWLANVVVVQKKNGKWRVCVDFTDLNKACPKDPFPLPHIDSMVDATAGHELLTFMDASSGFQQIQMEPSDQEDTAFMTPTGIYCYIAMLFGLRNAGATYQRLVNMMFKDQIGQTMEVYIDDMVVKSIKAEDHLRDLEEAFDILDRYNMKLNPSKCHFGVKAGKFLGYMVTKRGIEASPIQIKALVNIKSPANAKDVQRLTGRIAALNRFISKSSEKCKEFYDILRKNKKFEWTEKHESALRALKDYLSSAPALMKPEKGDVLSLYLAVSSKAVSAVLVKDHEGTQHPVYYVSKSLLDAESRYSHLEKLILALIMASTKLRHYFETHVIVVKTNFPIKNVLRKPEMSGRMAKWAVKLSAYDIRYEPRTAIKSQALADFMADFSSDLQKEAELEVQQLEETKDPWILYTDGSSNVKGTGLGILLKSPQGDIIPHSIACEFQTTNNEAEYEALIAGLQIAKHMGIRYLEVPREENTEADALANLGSSLKIPEDISIPINHILAPAIEDHVAMEIGEDSTIIPSEDTQSYSGSGSWISPIMRYLQHGEIPTGENPRAFKIKVSQFTILNNMLYKRSLAGPYLRCIEDPEVQEVLKDFHEGDCGNHTGGRALFSRILKTGYYWPTMKRDAVEYAKKCDPCQRHSNILHQPAEFLHSISSSWPFMRWGMDMVGKLPKAPGGRVFMLAMTDYFSKWIEAEAFAQVREKEVISFIKRNIITRFGIPSEIICDNDSQFIGGRTTNFCDSWGIKMITSTPVHS
ncbi:putative nucleotidyltransferase, Ribonuclease H [Helianthus annuus]|nr:putative nucleotidyltransferase, Ribonuclease H [Helianthus annuus]